MAVSREARSRRNRGQRLGSWLFVALVPAGCLLPNVGIGELATGGAAGGTSHGGRDGQSGSDTHGGRDGQSGSDTHGGRDGGRGGVGADPSGSAGEGGRSEGGSESSAGGAAEPDLGASGSAGASESAGGGWSALSCEALRERTLAALEVARECPLDREGANCDGVYTVCNCVNNDTVWDATSPEGELYDAMLQEYLARCPLTCRSCYAPKYPWRCFDGRCVSR